MVSSYTTNKAFEKPANGDYVDTWNIPVNGDFDIADKAFGGTYSVALTNANVTLTQANCQNVRIRFTGSLSGNIIIYFPSGVSGFFIVQNATSGTFSVTLASAGGAPGTTVVTEQGRTAFVFTDGSNVFYADDSRVALTAGTGITITGTTNLTISLTVPVAVANGGTGSTTASGARTNLAAAWTGQQIIAGSGLTGGGTLAADRTLSVPNGGITGAMLAAGAATTNLGYTPVNKAGDTVTGGINFPTGADTGYGGQAGFLAATGSVSVGAVMSFHRVGAYAINMGLDSDNVFRIGGWSASPNRLQLDMGGNVTFAGNVTAYSDIALKTDLTQITDALEIVKSLKGYRYTRTDIGQKEVGLVAQEVEPMLPELVMKSGEYKSLAYDRMVAVLVEAIKTLAARVELLEQK